MHLGSKMAEAWEHTFKISSNLEASEKCTLIILLKWFSPDHRGSSDALQEFWLVNVNRSLKVYLPSINFSHCWSPLFCNIFLKYWPDVLSSKTMWIRMHSIPRYCFKWVWVLNIPKCILSTKYYFLEKLTWKYKIGTNLNRTKSLFFQHFLLLCLSLTFLHLFKQLLHLNCCSQLVVTSNFVLFTVWNKANRAWA